MSIEKKQKKIISIIPIIFIATQSLYENETKKMTKIDLN